MLDFGQEGDRVEMRRERERNDDVRLEDRRRKKKMKPRLFWF